MMRRFLPLLATLCLYGCGEGNNDRPIKIAIIGAEPALANPNGGVLNLASQTLTYAVMQGLVVYNASGEVVPGLAESWIVTDDGLSYIFRIRRAQWSDGHEIKAEEVARSLRTSLGVTSRNPMRMHFYGVSDVVALTERVIEVRFKLPQASILPMLARPEMAILQKGRGTGPMSVQKSTPEDIIVRPALSKDQADEVGAAALKRYEIHLKNDTAARSIVRFGAGQVSLVLGGGFDDSPVLEAAQLSSDAVHRDPVFGLFGLVASASNTILATPYVRRALAMSIDRPALMTHFRTLNWQGQEALLPVSVDGLGEQPRPDWIGFDKKERVSRARSIIQGIKGREARIPLTIALPPGPGARILFAQLKSDWSLIGIDLKTAPDATADLRLIDSVAAFNGVGWYFGRLSCGQGFQCSREADAALLAARSATTIADRNAALVQANRALVADQVFIPIAQPLRWSLAQPEIEGFRENQVGIHPIRWLTRSKR
jgi:oligopeptide transport system substrate-binding protein